MAKQKNFEDELKADTNELKAKLERAGSVGPRTKKYFMKKEDGKTVMIEAVNLAEAYDKLNKLK